MTEIGERVKQGSETGIVFGFEDLGRKSMLGKPKFNVLVILDSTGQRFTFSQSGFSLPQILPSQMTATPELRKLRRSAAEELVKYCYEQAFSWFLIRYLNYQSGVPYGNEMNRHYPEFDAWLFAEESEPQPQANVLRQQVNQMTSSRDDWRGKQYYEAVEELREATRLAEKD